MAFIASAVNAASGPNANMGPWRVLQQHKQLNWDPIKNWTCHTLFIDHYFHIHVHLRSCLIASFPGSSAPECEHWSCAGARQREPGNLSHVSTIKGRTEVERRLNKLICTLVDPTTQSRKKSEDSRQLTTRIWLSGANIIHTEHWTHSWLNNAQNVAFLF